MSEKNERPKPPTRRTGGRALGGAKKTSPPPPPPAAELTPEQFAVEQSATQDEGRPVPDESEVHQFSTTPVETAQGYPTGVVYEGSQHQAPPTVDVASSGPGQASVAQPASPAAVDTAAQSVPSGHPTQGHEQFVARATGPAVAAAQATPLVEQVPQAGLARAASPTTGVSPTADVAVRPADSPVLGGVAFPMRSDVPVSYQEQRTRVEATPSEGTPWAQGPGRPQDIPETVAVLNQRIITRESLDSSVPAALRLKKRIKRFALDNELDHLPIGDIVAVALDEWLTTRGF
ncbi:hypothetical protein OOK29_23785 [Streptomyces phaeochromogenes]|uniref:hypothetical protein n=1 Tax=Streptomyces phaeochromogenes TaxID=1923 RepID=UPI0022516B6B|nr:hypothetical protein [Streptomyces phaeochromogenes]MCX5601174.1 hypothetical protein [Streptomyces phaeochromogenes]